MNTTAQTLFRQGATRWRFAVLFLFVGLSACGWSGWGEGNGTNSVTAITAQPTDQSVVAGSAATFTVAANNATGYQWQRSTDGGTTFVDVSGATAASHTTPVTTLADSGAKYRVVVSGAGNSVTSSAVTLTVTTTVVIPSISVQPANQTITAGQNASFSVTASGTSLSYQWQRSTDGGTTFNNEAGATNATLTLTAVPLANNTHRFRVVVSNSAGSVTSNAALLTVNQASAIPAFSTQPANQSVTAPNTASFAVVVTGSPSPTLQWQLSTDAGVSFAGIAGATGSSYTTPATVTGDNGNQYRVVATNATGNVTSNAATLTVTAAAIAPTFTTQPASVTITAGQSTQFTVAVSGTPTPTLQWQLSTDSGVNWSNIVGETGTTFTALNVALANNGRQFRAVASNGVGAAVNSSAATLTVNAGTPTMGWSSAITLSLDQPGAAETPKIAFDGNGNAIAVWAQDGDTSPSYRRDIWARRFTPAGGWTPAVLIETNDLGQAVSPDIAMDSAGNALVVWLQQDGVTRFNIWANRYTSTGGWGTAELIESVSASTYTASDVRIAMDNSGRGIAVWYQVEASLSSIRAARFSGGWSASVEVGAGYLPKLAMNANGQAMVVFAASDASPSTLLSVWARPYNVVSDSWGTAELIEFDSTGGSDLPSQVAIDPAGRAIAVMRRVDSTTSQFIVRANRYAAGAWSVPVRIDTSNADRPDEVQVALDADGNAIAVWDQYTNGTGGYSQIWANRYTVNGSWGTAAMIEASFSATDNFPARKPQIAFAPVGNAFAIWEDGGGSTGAAYTPASGWGVPRDMGTGTTTPPQDPQIVFDSSGRAFAIWTQTSGVTSSYTIWVSRYE